MPARKQAVIEDHAAWIAQAVAAPFHTPRRLPTKRDGLPSKQEMREHQPGLWEQLDEELPKVPAPTRATLSPWTPPPDPEPSQAPAPEAGTPSIVDRHAPMMFRLHDIDEDDVRFEGLVDAYLGTVACDEGLTHLFRVVDPGPGVGPVGTLYTLTKFYGDPDQTPWLQDVEGEDEPAMARAIAAVTRTYLALGVVPAAEARAAREQSGAGRRPGSRRRARNPK